MATQLITVVGMVGKVDLNKLERLCASPGNLPIIHYSQWVDSWTPMLQLVELLRPSVARQRIATLDRVQILLTERNQARFQNLLASMRRRRRDSELFKLVQEISQALQWVKPWKGKVAVTIQLLGSSISDDDISKFLKSKGKINPTWMKSKSHKHQLSVMACRVSL